MELVARRRWAIGLVNLWCWIVRARALWGFAPLTAILTWRYTVALVRWRGLR